MAHECHARHVHQSHDAGAHSPELHGVPRRRHGAAKSSVDRLIRQIPHRRGGRREEGDGLLLLLLLLMLLLVVIIVVVGCDFLLLVLLFVGIVGC